MRCCKPKSQAFKTPASSNGLFEGLSRHGATWDTFALEKILNRGPLRATSE